MGCWLDAQGLKNIKRITPIAHRLGYTTSKEERFYYLSLEGCIVNGSKWRLDNGQGRGIFEYFRIYLV